VESAALEVLEALTEAAYTKDRAAPLRRAALALQRLRLLLRLAKDVKALDFKRYGHAAVTVDEIGRMIGGWSRHDKGRTV